MSRMEMQILGEHVASWRGNRLQGRGDHPTVPQLWFAGLHTSVLNIASETGMVYLHFYLWHIVLNAVELNK